MKDRHRAQAPRLADGLRHEGFDVLNRVVLNQVLVRGSSDQATAKIRDQALATGVIWFGSTR